jgi:hypothetical protein
MATSYRSGAARIVEALGLKNVRSMRLNMEAGSVVAVVTEQYVSGEQLDGLAGELERKEWVLVPKDEWDRANAAKGEAAGVIEKLRHRLRLSDAAVRSQPTLTDEEREAIERDLSWLQWCEDNSQIGDVGRKDIATLRKLLERAARSKP